MIAFDTDVLTEILLGDAAFAARAAAIPVHQQAVPVIVIERQNRPGAFARSGELVLPHRRTVVGVLLVSVVVAGGIDIGLGALVAYGLHGWVETWLTDVLDGVIFSSALVAVSTSLYYGLLEARPPSGKEGHRTRPRQLQPWAEDVSRLAR